MTTVGDRLFHLGGAPVGLLDHLCPQKVHMCVRPSTSSTSRQTHAWWNGRWKRGNFFTSLSSAYTATTTGANEVILLSPDHHSQTAAIAWARNDTHLIGMTHLHPLHPRTSIGHGSTALTPMITVSGRGNLFANLYLTYGLVAEDLIDVRVTGRENMFQDVHFSTPRNSAAGDIATHYALSVESEYGYFKHCMIGNDIQPRVQGAVINISGTRNVFEDCIIKLYVDAVDSFFIKTSAGHAKFQLFKNCTFVSTSINQVYPLTYGVSHHGGQGELVFDNCTFAGCTDIVAVGQESLIWMGPTTYAPQYSTGLAQHPDVDSN